MAKTITLTYEKKEYTLEYNRTAAKMIQDQGFDPDQLGTKQITMVMLVFYGAFMMHHQNVKRAKMDSIFESLTHRMELTKELLDMYSDTANVLSDEEDGADEGNANWGKNE